MSDLSGFDHLKMKALEQAVKFCDVLVPLNDVREVCVVAETFLNFLKTGRAQ